jgi:plastocyanin
VAEVHTETGSSGLGIRARKVLAACAAVGAVAAIAAPSASAAPAMITGTALNTFDMNGGSYPHGAAEIALFTSTGGSHNVTATANGPDGKVLFSSATISSGTTPVNGTQYLALGSYAFICTVHPATMAANLNVNAGTPLPRPGVSLKVKTSDLDQAVRQRAVKVKVTITGGSGEEAEIGLKLGKKTIGSGATNATKKLKIKLTKKGRAALAKKDKAKVKAAATIDFGAPATAKGTLK